MERKEGKQERNKWREWKNKKETKKKRDWKGTLKTDWIAKNEKTNKRKIECVIMGQNDKENRRTKNLNDRAKKKKKL